MKCNFSIIYYNFSKPFSYNRSRQHNEYHSDTIKRKKSSIIISYNVKQFEKIVQKSRNKKKMNEKT